ncbi:hypothetical protein D3C75_1173840 [compost metagenome]
MNALEHILRPQYQRIKQRPYYAKNHAEDQIQPERVQRGIAELADLNHRRFAIKQAEDDARHDHARKDRFN